MTLLVRPTTPRISAKRHASFTVLRNRSDQQLLLAPKVEHNDACQFLGPGVDGENETLHLQRTLRTVKGKLRYSSRPENTGVKDLVLSRPSNQTQSSGQVTAIETGKLLRAKVFTFTKSAALSLGISKPPPKKYSVDKMCSGCQQTPIIGDVYTCSRCTYVYLCEVCYAQGVHGYEGLPETKLLQAQMVIDDAKLKFKALPEELLQLLYKDICNESAQRFQFLSNWLGMVVDGGQIKKLPVRGMEIPRINSVARSRLVQMLVPLVATRTDIHVNFEWVKENLENADDSEILRIWIANPNGKSESPFADSLMKKNGSKSEGDSRIAAGASNYDGVQNARKICRETQERNRTDKDEKRELTSYSRQDTIEEGEKPSTAHAEESETKIECSTRCEEHRSQSKPSHHAKRVLENRLSKLDELEVLEVIETSKPVQSKSPFHQDGSSDLISV